MKIPKSFQIGGLSIKVEQKKNIDIEGAIGCCKYLENKIQVRTHIDNKPIHKEQKEQTFYHELVHQILFVMNEDDLNANEKFVDNFASLLYQVLKTSKS